MSLIGRESWLDSETRPELDGEMSEAVVKPMLYTYEMTDPFRCVVVSSVPMEDDNFEGNHFLVPADKLTSLEGVCNTVSNVLRNGGANVLQNS